MGLGLHGGGAASAEYFIKHGAFVTVTDLKNREILIPSIDKIQSVLKKPAHRAGKVRFVLGRHEMDDFINTDLIIKNPGVPRSSPFLREAEKKGIPVETDLSIFLKFTDNPVIAVTGSKGKSTTVSAIHHCLRSIYPDSRLGGNIAVSPLTFIDEIKPEDPVVLETSSWQLADLKGNEDFKPKIAVLTNILPDHMDRYSNMKDYIDDKKIIFAGQDLNDYAVLNRDDPSTEDIQKHIKAKIYYFSGRPFTSGTVKGAYLDPSLGKGFLMLSGKPVILLERFPLPGGHNRINLLAAALALSLYGIDTDTIIETLKEFKGIEHRLELFLTENKIRFYNDSAATIPQAAIEAIRSLYKTNGPYKSIYLITGGTDKNLDFTPLADYLSIPEKIFLIKGSATEKIISLLKEKDIDYHGPYEALDEVIDSIRAHLHGGVSVLFSPGCASFELFKNEFHRGSVFKKLILSEFSRPKV
ncbi:MAG: UDP-N-acetylmuramoyl-L-alanine--D-glutamate ligase [Spirochaetes bacterium]|nr:UDP-N-acetylmuramoyl-L-alanine--D-glutamate ligase [Spirochaetota bacterium]